MRRLDHTEKGALPKSLEASLLAKIIGQENAVREIVDAYSMYDAGLCEPGRPIANLLFLGPTGTGKTRTVECCAEYFVGDLNAVIKINCGEFQMAHDTAKLLGAPPGYLGHRETQSPLRQKKLNEHHTETHKLTFVLFDEIEKAHPAFWDLLLGILDKATLRFGDDSVADFSRCVICMTANLGAREMQNLLGSQLGFAHPQASGSTIANAGVKAARDKFSPEFFNRLDKVVSFNSLTEEHLATILDLELDTAITRVQTRAGNAICFEITETAHRFLLRDGSDLRYGARHLKRSIRRHVLMPLANLISRNELSAEMTVVIDADATGIVFLADDVAVQLAA